MAGIASASLSSFSVKEPVAVVEVDEGRELLKYGLERKPNGLIGWLAESDDHPRNWSVGRKSFDTVLIILLEFYTYVSNILLFIRSSHESQNRHKYYRCKIPNSSRGILALLCARLV